MKNKKGFTLVELLAVIVLLAVIGLIGFASTQKIKENIDRNVFQTTLEDVLTSAETYGSDNVEELSAGDTFVKDGKERKYIILTVADLIRYKYVDTTDIIDKNELSAASQGYCLAPEVDCEMLELEGEACTNETERIKNGYCRSVNNADGNSINDLAIVVYFANQSGRVATCIPDASFNPLFSTNLKILGDPDKSIYGADNIYCAEDVVDAGGGGGGTSTSSFNISLTVMDALKWERTKQLKARIEPALVTPTKYAIVKGNNCSVVTDSNWLDITPDKLNNDFYTTVTEPGEYSLCARWDNPTDPSTQILEGTVVDVTTIDNSISCTVSGASTTWSNSRTLTVNCVDEPSGIHFNCPSNASCSGNTIHIDSGTMPENNLKQISFSVSDDAENVQNFPNIDVYVDTKAPLYNGLSNSFGGDEAKIDSMVNLNFLFSDLIKVINGLCKIFPISLLGLKFSPYSNPKCTEKMVNGNKVAVCTTKACVDGFTNATGGFNFGTSVFLTPTDNGGSGYNNITSEQQWYNKKKQKLTKPVCDASDDYCYWNIGYFANDKAGNSRLIGVLYVYVEFVDRSVAIACNGNPDIVDSYGVGV